MLKKAAVLGVVLVSLFVFGGLSITQAQDEPPVKAGLTLYQGEGWWFYYPEQAVLNAISETEFSVVGPLVRVRHPDFDAQIETPAYQLDVVVYDNPALLSPEDWAEQQILADWQAIQAQGGPNVLPVTEDGTALDPARVQSVVINGTPGFRVTFFNFDSERLQVYLPAADKIVVFRYVQNIVENIPVAAMQWDIYTLILNTFEVAAE